MQRRMGDLDDENNGGIEEDSREKLRLPTLTLYTGTDQRPSSSNNNKPPINLHLSLGGSYSNSNSTTLDENNMNNVDQTAATPAHQQQEIISVDDDDIDWAARSASENQALIRALRVIKSKSCTNTATHHRRKTSSSSSSSHLRNQGVFFQQQPQQQQQQQQQQEEEGGIGKCMMNPDDFLSINFDDHDNINAFKDASSSSSSSSANNIRLLFPTHHHDKGKSAPPIPNYYYNSNNNIVAPQGGYTAAVAPQGGYTAAVAPQGGYTAAVAPPPFAFASNHWSNGALMKKNEYVRDSEVEMIRLMPTVATEGGIPGGRRIEGFLYRYSKYEDVIIVCFCHGRFFTPKEFVMHAAAEAGVTVTEFQNPMRLITIVPND